MNTVLNETSIPSRLKNFFETPQFLEKSLDPSSSQFWIFLKTLKKYLDHPESGGFLPLQSKLPDMFSDSENYVNLLKVYRAGMGASADHTNFKGSVFG